MRLTALGASLGALTALAACDAWETAPPPPPPAPPAIVETAPPTFNDGGCLAYLQLQRRAVAQARAEGDTATIDAALEAWRARAGQTLSAEELAQYETSSLAEHDDESVEQIAERAAACMSNAQAPAAEGETSAAPPANP